MRTITVLTIAQLSEREQIPSVAKRQSAREEAQGGARLIPEWLKSRENQSKPETSRSAPIKPLLKTEFSAKFGGRFIEAMFQAKLQESMIWTCHLRVAMEQ